jgi:hypothetical protein
MSGMRCAQASLLMILLCLSACIPAPDAGRRPSHRPTSRAATPDTRQCLADLDRVRARYTLLPEQDFGGGCSNRSTVQLLDVGIPVTNVKAVKCDVARALALWVRESVQPAARDHFGSRVVRLESMGAYACRNVIGNAASAGQRSEHATGNAIDIGAFVLADGRRVSVIGGWNGDSDSRAFLRDVRAGGCKRFQTVLSPDYNAAHHDHLHFDMGRGPFCR